MIALGITGFVTRTCGECHNNSLRECDLTYSDNVQTRIEFVTICLKRILQIVIQPVKLVYEHLLQRGYITGCGFYPAGVLRPKPYRLLTPCA
jgi:hypothetical protein